MDTHLLELHIARATSSDEALLEIDDVVRKHLWVLENSGPFDLSTDDGLVRFRQEFKIVCDSVLTITKNALNDSGKLLNQISELVNPQTPKCPSCGGEQFTHMYDAMHGIAETYMSGTERFVCKSCDYCIYRDEGIPLGFKYSMNE